MKSLRGLSDKALVRQLHRIVSEEKQLTFEVLSHLAEVARRELYLAKGYSTLSDYCVCELGYGESSAWRRVRVARVIKDVPQVYDLMKSGELTFSAVLQVAGGVTLSPALHTTTQDWVKFPFTVKGKMTQVSKDRHRSGSSSKRCMKFDSPRMRNSWS
jgi:hypothetical protein